MANTITDLAGELYIASTQARWARPIPAALLSNWSQLRVGIRVRVADTGGNITGTPKLDFGLCSGGTNIMGDATTDHFVGGRTDVATWTRSASPTRYAITSFVAFKRVGVVDTTGGDMVATMYLKSANWHVIYLDIVKGSPNYTLTPYYCNATTATDVQATGFYAGFRYFAPTLTSHTAGTAQTIAVNEATNGTLDHVCFSWDQASVFLVADVAVRRMS